MHFPFPYSQGIIHPRLSQVAAPASEPVDLASAKAHARIDIDDDDTLITGLITAARLLIENKLNRSLISTQWTYNIDYFANSNQTNASFYWPLKLPIASVISVDSITYRDTAGNTTTLDPSVYNTSTGAPGYVQPVQGAVWPATSPWYTGAVTITFTAGYGADASYVPENLKLALKALVATWYAQREHLTEGTLNTVPDYVDALLDRERWY